MAVRQLKSNRLREADCRLTEVRVIAPSGAAEFDEAALDLIRRSQPLAAPPEARPPRGMSFVAPAQFAPYAAKWRDPAS